MSKPKQTKKNQAAINDEVDNEAAFLNNYGALLKAIEMVKGLCLFDEDVINPKDIIATCLIKDHLEKECAELRKKLPDYSEEVIRRMAIINLAYEANQFHELAFNN